MLGSRGSGGCGKSGGDQGAAEFGEHVLERGFGLGGVPGLDIAAYAEALGDAGATAYRNRLADIETRLGPRPSREDRWQSVNSRVGFTLDWNAKRLAVLDRDIDAIIRTDVGDRKATAWFTDTAEAFEEIREYDLAIDWARQATEFGLGHQSVIAARHWSELIDTYRPAEAPDTRVYLFRRWPNSSAASELRRAADEAWPTYRDEVMEKLSHHPYDAVTFTLNTLNDPKAAWDLAHDLCLDSDHTWADRGHVRLSRKTSTSSNPNLQIH